MNYVLRKKMISIFGVAVACLLDTKWIWLSWKVREREGERERERKKNLILGLFLDGADCVNKLLKMNCNQKLLSWPTKGKLKKNKSQFEMCARFCSRLTQKRATFFPSFVFHHPQQKTIEYKKSRFKYIMCIHCLTALIFFNHIPVLLLTDTKNLFKF